jgi:hypothetical protein
MRKSDFALAAVLALGSRLPRGSRSVGQQSRKRCFNFVVDPTLGARDLADLQRTKLDSSATVAQLVETAPICVFPIPSKVVPVPTTVVSTRIRRPVVTPLV